MQDRELIKRDSMSIRLFFTGDIVITREWSGPLLGFNLQQIAKSADVVCCNFEAPIAFDGQTKALKIGPSISQNKKTIDILKKDMFSLFSLANNHIMDYGIEGLKRTLNYCQEKGIECIGAGINPDDAYKPFIFEKEGIVIGIISCAENGFGTSIREDSGGYAWFGAHKFNCVLDELIKCCNYVFIICHGGAEKWDLPLPEYREMYKSWIDRGAKGVIAHHPHVPQGFENYKGCGIYYSLGNFAFDKGVGIQDPRAICAEIIIDNNVSFHSIPTIFNENGVDVCEDTIFAKHIKKCNDLLSDSKYIDTINSMCLKAFQEKYKGYFGAILNMYSGGIKQFGKTFLFRTINNKKFSNEWLYHNLVIETHYWICRRSVDLLINPLNLENDYEDSIY